MPEKFTELPHFLTDSFADDLYHKKPDKSKCSRILRNEENREDKEYEKMENLPQVNTKVMCAMLTAIVLDLQHAEERHLQARRSAASESQNRRRRRSHRATEQNLMEQKCGNRGNQGEEKVLEILSVRSLRDGNVISIALAEKPETRMGSIYWRRPPAKHLEAISLTDGHPDGNGGTPNGDAPAGEVPSGEKSDGPAPDGKKPTGEAPDGQKSEKDMLDEMTLTLSGDTMTITVNDDTIITIDGTDATPDDLQVGDTVSFFLDGDIVTSLSVGMPEPAQPGRSMQAPEQK